MPSDARRTVGEPITGPLGNVAAVSRWRFVVPDNRCAPLTAICRSASAATPRTVVALTSCTSRLLPFVSPLERTTRHARRCLSGDLHVAGLSGQPEPSAEDDGGWRRHS